MTKSKAEPLADFLRGVRFSGDLQSGFHPITGDEIAAHLRAQDALIGELVEALKLIQHATAPNPVDGGEHEDAFELATEALAKAEAAR